MLTLALALGYLLDAVLGDPRWLYHPVRLIGWLIEAMEKGLRHIFSPTPRGERIAGGILAATVPLLTMLTAGASLWLAARIHRFAWLLLEAVFCYFLLAAKSLKVESMEVYHQLKAGDMPAARKALSWIVGRDTETLDESGIVKAAVETVAENTSDGVVAPLFYTILGGSVLGWGYKAVNTLDSMVGYQNDKYRYLGTASARLDDLLNLLPARIGAALMVASSALCRMDAKAAWRIWRRDHANHPSPNSAHTEAACAGALHIRLAGGASYFGQWKEKPTIGDNIRPPEPEDIVRANRLMQTTALLSLLLFAAVRGGLLLLLKGIIG